MKISFLIPAYNEEKYIAKCLASLAKQENLVDFEVIVVDNNSKDSTAKIVQEKFPVVRLVREPKQGMTIARNKGAREAKGDILVFVDADTMLSPSWGERMLARFSKNPSLAGISGPSRFYDLPLQYKFIEFIDFQIIFPFLGEFLLKNILRKGALWNGAIIAARKDLFEQAGMFSEDIVFYGEDADLAKRLMKLGKIEFVQDLWVLSSARRLMKGNPVLEGLKYVLQYSWFLLTNRSAGKSYKVIR